MVAILRERFPGIVGPKKEDICYATTNRQAAVKAIAARCDRLIVVGAPNSSNSLRLVEVPRFRMGYDFLAIRAASGEVPAELEAWWRAFQSADGETRRAMLLPETGTKKRRRRRRRKKSGPPSPAAEA